MCFTANRSSNTNELAFLMLYLVSCLFLMTCYIEENVHVVSKSSHLMKDTTVTYTSPDDILFDIRLIGVNHHIQSLDIGITISNTSDYTYDIADWGAYGHNVGISNSVDYAHICDVAADGAVVLIRPRGSERGSILPESVVMDGTLPQFEEGRTLSLGPRESSSFTFYRSYADWFLEPGMYEIEVLYKTAIAQSRILGNPKGTSVCASGFLEIEVKAS